MKIETEIEKQAAEFLARVYSANMSEAEEQRLFAWLGQDDSHRRAYASMLELWDECGDMQEDPAFTKVSAGSVDLSEDESGGTRSFNGIRSVAAMLALLAVTGAGVGLFRLASDGPESGRFETEVGEQRTVTLADKSVVTLNTDTRLFVDQTEAYRHVVLDKGEAFFDVARDRSRPFLVEAGNQTVTVLGTKFNVLRSENEVTVAVLEGVVEVQNKLDLKRPSEILADQADLGDEVDEEDDEDEAPYRLAAGSVATFSHRTDVVSAQASFEDVARVQSWRAGIVRFNEERLGAVVAEMNRYRETPIVLNGSEVGDLLVSGVFHLDDIDGGLIGLESFLPIRIARSADGVWIHLD